MKNSIFIILILTIISGNSTFAQDKSLQEKLGGAWVGTLKINTMELRVVIRFEEKNKKLNAYLDSPDQGVKGIVVDEFSLFSDTLIFSVKAINAKFSGNLNEKERKITGTFSQSGMSFPLTLTKLEKPIEILRPQEPKEPFDYKIEEVEFISTKANIWLSGTLTIPNGKGPFPAAVLVTGSGPQNRNEELLNHKPFWVIADYLTKNGIAVLRYDDRGVGKSKGNFAEASTMDFADDAEAGVEFLKKRSDINSSKTGIIGHSEGALASIIVASRNKSVDFIVMLAGPGTTGEEILLAQQKLIAKASGFPDSEIEKEQEQSRRIYNIIRNTEDHTKLYDLIKSELKKDKIVSDSGTNEANIEMIAKQLSTRWFKEFLSFNPAEYLKDVKCPVLALNGSLDLQVPAKENLGEIDRILKTSGNTKYEIKEFPGLNHLFQSAKTGSPAEYGTIEETFSEKVLSYMTNWIRSFAD